MVQAGSVVKLFVGQIPKTLEEDGVREVFQEYGEIAEIVILRDRRSGMHQGCCFVKYNGLQAAQAAISALHNQRSLPPLRNPLQVRFADSGSNGGERGQTNAENKLFVGGVPSGCGEKELRQLFGTYGEVQDVYILASKYGSQEGQRGCAFVRYASPQSCVVAINALHGKYAMKAGELPLAVRYADPPKSRSVGPNGVYGGANGGGNGRFGGWNNGAPPLWPPSGAPAPPPGWPLPWNMGGPGGPNAYGPPWAMSNGYNYPPQQPSPPPPQQPPPPPPQYQQAPPPRKHSPPAAGYGGVSPPTTADMPPPPPPPPAAAPVPASNWSEHRTADGLKYFYNTATGTSSWERPPELASAPSPPVATPPVSVPPLMGGGGGGGGGGTTAAAAALANSMASLSLAAPTASLPMGGNGMGSGMGNGMGNSMGNSMHSNSMSMAMGGLASDSYSGYSNGSFTGSGKAGPDTAATLPGLGAFASNNNGAPNGHSGVVKQGSAVLVSDLPPHFSPSDLQTAFSRFGTITFCELETGSSSGRVGFDSPLSALHAANTMNGAAVGDSTLQVVGLPYLPASA